MTTISERLRAEPLDEDFRAVGYTGAARERPIEEAMALVIFAAWNGVEPHQLPEAMRYFPNEATKLAWERVARAAYEYLMPALARK